MAIAFDLILASTRCDTLPNHDPHKFYTKFMNISIHQRHNLWITCEKATDIDDDNGNDGGHCFI